MLGIIPVFVTWIYAEYLEYKKTPPPPKVYELPQLPYPIEEASVVFDAAHTFIAWPKRWIAPLPKPYQKVATKKEKGKYVQQDKPKPSQKDATKKEKGKNVQQDKPASKIIIPTKKRRSVSKPVKPSGHDQAGPSSSIDINSTGVDSFRLKLKALAKKMTNEDLVPVNITRTIYYSEVTEMLDNEVLLEVINHQWIGSSVINMWIQHLHDEVIVPGENASFAFINPNSTSVINGKPMWNKEDIKCRMRTCATERTLFLAPMNVGNHWVLIAFNPMVKDVKDIVVYYLDPIETALPSNRPNYMCFINSLITAFRANCKNKNLAYSKSTDQTQSYPWLKIQCPFQPNDNDCGYYVMKFIKDIVTHDQLEVPEFYYEDCRSSKLSMEEVDDLIEEWCKYVFPIAHPIIQNLHPS